MLTIRRGPNGHAVYELQPREPTVVRADSTPALVPHILQPGQRRFRRWVTANTPQLYAMCRYVEDELGKAVRDDPRFYLLPAMIAQGVTEYAYHSSSHAPPEKVVHNEQYAADDVGEKDD